MAQIIEFRAASGLTLTAKVFTAGSDTVTQTASAVTEATNRKGTYAAAFTGLTLAEYEIIGFSGTIPVARWAADITSNNGTHQAYEPPATYWTKTRAGYLDSVLLAESPQRTVSVTGSHHVAADVHAFQPDVIDSAALATSAVTEIQTGLATSTAQTTAQSDIDDIQSRLPAALVGGRMDASVGAMQADTFTAAALATSAVTEIQTGLATSANQTLILDRQGFALAVLAGTISDAQTAAETYAITLGANTFTVDFAGLDASGNRSGQTLVKT